MPQAAPFLAIAAAAVSAVGSISQGKAAKDAADFQAELGQRQAERERQIAERDAELFARKQSADRAGTRAVRAASGVTGEGSTLLVDETLIDEALLGEETIRRGGEAKASTLQAEASLARFRGRAARTAGFTKAGSTLLTAAAKAFR